MQYASKMQFENWPLPYVTVQKEEPCKKPGHQGAGKIFLNPSTSEGDAGNLRRGIPFVRKTKICRAVTVQQIFCRFAKLSQIFAQYFSIFTQIFSRRVSAVEDIFRREYFCQPFFLKKPCLLLQVFLKFLVQKCSVYYFLELVSKK